MEIKKVLTEIEINLLKNFLLENTSFDFELTQGELNQLQNMQQSIKEDNITYWIALEGDKVIGAIGVFPNEYETGGFEFDFFAVNKNFRRKGVGKLLFNELENFVKSNNARFILVSTGSLETSLSARNFYEKNGFIKVGETPDFFGEGHAKIDYFKKI